MKVMAIIHNKKKLCIIFLLGKWVKEKRGKKEEKINPFHFPLIYSFAS